jgi:hypothetical protein
MSTTSCGRLLIVVLGLAAPCSGCGGTEKPAEDGQAESPGTTVVETLPGENASSLCKRAGIRYVGSTVQGAEVCFTLTRDRRALVESGYGFVEASRCPEGLTGDDHNFYRGRVDSSGRVGNSHGFIAVIRGASASGTVEDPAICRGKKFRWQASQQP